jgi:hypothetical protein
MLAQKTVQVIHPNRSTCAFRRNNFRSWAERKMSYPTNAPALPNNPKPAIITKNFSTSMSHFSLQLFATVLQTAIRNLLPAGFDFRGKMPAIPSLV